MCCWVSSGELRSATQSENRPQCKRKTGVIGRMYSGNHEVAKEKCTVRGCLEYSKYFRNTNIEHVVLPSKSGSKPTVKGAYHLNNVNAMHSRFKAFLRNYNGVSTKYLNNYLSLFLWLENNKYYDKQNLMCEQLSKAGSQITANKLHQFAPTPDYAPAA